MIDIVGLAGSLGPQSASLAALNVALNGAREYGASVELFDLRELSLPMYVPGAPVPDAAPETLRRDIRRARNAVEQSALSRHDQRRVQECARLAPAARRSDATLFDRQGRWSHQHRWGTHGLQAVNTMEFVVRALRGWAVPLVLPIPQALRVFQEGRVLDPSCRGSNYARSDTSSPARRGCSGRRR